MVDCFYMCWKENDCIFFIELLTLLWIYVCVLDFPRKMYHTCVCVCIAYACMHPLCVVTYDSNYMQYGDA